MLVLGVTGGTIEHEGIEYCIGYHDSSASLIKDGKLVAAIEQERLDRSKHSSSFPKEAIESCLDVVNASICDIDAVGYYFSSEFIDFGLNSSSPLRRLVRTVSSRDLLMNWLSDNLGIRIPTERLFFVPHHTCHAMATFSHSGMRDALVIVMDGQGELNSCTIYRGTTGGLDHLYSYSKLKSLGLLYLYATSHLGYGYGDEYKVMGLAPYGDPSVYRHIFESFCKLREGGEYDFLWENGGFSLIETPYDRFSRILIENEILPRAKDADFTQQHKDLAASLQEALERIALHIIAYWAKTTGASNLCFSGGVAHNSSLNGAIVGSGLFKEVFVHPASHDGGAGEGAGLVAAHILGEEIFPQQKLQHANYGPDLGDNDEILEKLETWKEFVQYQQSDDVVTTAAKLLADGAVLGWASGRSEFGPRALGNRSILADPRPAENQTRINSVIKNRESFRPFAPVVTWESAGEYFDIPKTTANYDFMSYVVPVRPNVRGKLGAVTHVDGTARLQVIRKESNEKFYNLVKRFGQLTGTPVLLNTSFNNNAEPIVQTIADSVTCFLTTGLDYLVLGDYIVKRKMNRVTRLESLVPRLRPGTELMRRFGVDKAARKGEDSFVIECSRIARPSTVLSSRLFSLLEKSDGIRTVSELIGSSGVLTEAESDELLSLWCDRFIIMEPK